MRIVLLLEVVYGKRRRQWGMGTPLSICSAICQAMGPKNSELVEFLHLYSARAKTSLNNSLDEFAINLQRVSLLDFHSCSCRISFRVLSCLTRATAPMKRYAAGISRVGLRDLGSDR